MTEAALPLQPPRLSGVGLHLWPTVTGCEHLACNHPDRWRWFDAKSASLILRIVLNRLVRRPAEIEVRAHGPEVDLLSEHPECPDNGYLVLATFFQGVTLDEIEEAHQDLIIHHWLPEALRGPPRQQAA